MSSAISFESSQIALIGHDDLVIGLIMQQAHSWVNGCLGLFMILSTVFRIKNDPCTSVYSSGTVNFGSWLLVGLFVVEGHMSKMAR